MRQIKQKVAVIGTVGVPACYGGYETLAENLVKELADRFEFTIYCSRLAYRKRPKEYCGAHLKYIPLKANGLSCLPYDSLCALDAARKADVLLLLGPNAIWVLGLLRRLGMKKKIISNVDGLESNREKFNAVLKFYCDQLEAATARNSDVVIADNQVIADHLLAHYPRVNCRLIEYGADHCFTVPVASKDTKRWPFLNGNYAFSVCRIEKENNVHLTLEAFRENAVMPLVIVGNWNKSEFSRSLREQYAGRKDIYLLDPIYEPQALNLLRSNCRVYIHGHHCGGTNPSLVEAMYLGRAIYAFDVNFNRETTEYSAQYYSDAAELKAKLAQATEADLESCGRALKAIAERRYTWKRIASLYTELFEQGEK